VALCLLDGQLILDAWSHPVVALILIVLCVAILIGLLTPVASMAAAIMQLAGYVTYFLAADAHATHLRQSGETALFCIALSLLGPGAYACDARLFGRREIVIPKDRRPL
jgi:uncharacterized membrane protein YphA (DoxX/SURF4 family)